MNKQIKNSLTLNYYKKNLSTFNKHFCIGYFNNKNPCITIIRAKNPPPMEVSGETNEDEHTRY